MHLWKLPDDFHLEKEFPFSLYGHLTSCHLLEERDDSERHHFPGWTRNCSGNEGLSLQPARKCQFSRRNLIVGKILGKCMCLSFPKQISSTSSQSRPPRPWIKGRVSSTVAPVLLQAPPSSLAFEPSSVRLFPKLVGARTHQGHLSPTLSSHRLVQACAIYNFCHLSWTMCIYMHICTQTLALPLVSLH